VGALSGMMFVNFNTRLMCTDCIDLHGQGR